MHTHALPFTPVHTSTHPCTPMLYSHTPHTYPLMPADALDLINHMKLHVNRKKGEERKIDR